MNDRPRHKRPPSPHPAELDPTSPHAPLPPGTVVLRCRQTYDVVGDVLERDEGWWPDGRRYDVWLNDSACSEDHVHERPTQEEIVARVEEAKREKAVIQHRVNVRR